MGGDLARGTIFRATHDDTFDGWNSGDSRSKYGLVFNIDPVASDDDDVLYFLTTSKVDKFRENPSLTSEGLFLPRGSYEFFDEETWIDFRNLNRVSLSKLQTKRLRIVGKLTPEHIQECEKRIKLARIISNREKKVLGLR